MKTATPLSSMSQADISKAWAQGLNALSFGARESLDAIHAGQHEMITQAQELATIDPSNSNIVPVFADATRAQIKSLQTLGVTLGKIAHDTWAKTPAAAAMAQDKA